MGTQTLHHLHTVLQVIHCDLKPSNLYYDRKSGTVVLMDFGSSRPGPEFSGGM
jgi:serine/threonine protein kinase